MKRTRAAFSFMVGEKYRIDFITADNKVAIRHWFGCDVGSTIIAENSYNGITDAINTHEREMHSDGSKDGKPSKSSG